MALNDPKKRDFSKQIIALLESNAEVLTNVGYDPTEKITELRDQSQQAEDAEAKQTEAEVEAKNATENAQKTLTTVYKNAAATVDLITGLLGKDHNLVKEIKKMRK